ncbi:MAG: protein kinase, partial [Bradymonadaceae bacterium]
ICPECLERVDDQYDHCPDDGTELRDIHARDDDPMEGRILDEKWVLESRIGGGGMGTVYRAHQLSVDRTVAVKVLRSALVEDDDHVERFFREANVASNIHDSRCVTIYDFGQTADDHVLYLAMEYLEGRSLQHQIDHRMPTFEETLQIGIQICEALGVLHGNGVIHRDLKPENVYLIGEIGEDVFLKLLDFGLAKVAHSDATPVTATGEVFGTPTFMSPEQCMGSEVGFASDLYALGCMLYELVAGRTPFLGTSSVQILLGHVNRRPPPLTDQVDVPAEFEQLVDELLSKAPGDRPSSAEMVKQRLERILQDISAETAARAPPPGSESEQMASPVAETLPGGAEGPKFETDEYAGEEGFDETQGGVGPVRDDSGSKDGGSSPTPQDGGEEEKPTAPQPDTPDRGRVRFVVAAVVFVLGLAVMWTVMGPAEPGSVESSPGGTGATAARRLGGSAVPATEDALRRGGYWAATSASILPGSVGFGVGSLGEAVAEAEPTEGATVPASTGTRSGSDGEDGEGGGAGDPTLPVLTQAAATQVFRSKSGQIKSCFEKAAGKPNFDGGNLRLRLVIEKAGGVEEASIASATVEEEVVKRCAIERAKTWSFPPPPDEGTAVLLHEYGFEWKTLEQGKGQKAKDK